MPITLVGHPFAPIGMGEQLRSHIAAMAALELHHRVLDIFRYSGRTDDAHAMVVGDREILVPPAGIRIFHVNGDEAPRAIDAFGQRAGDFAAGTNVVVPAWELPRYPKAWVPALRRFDEIWAISSFVRDSLAEAGLSSHLIGQSVGPHAGPLLPRRWFGLRESAFVLLHFFDLSSFATRKNPAGVLDLFARLRHALPDADLQLALKVKDGERAADAWSSASVPDDPAIRVLSEPLDTLGVRGLIAAADVFVSLHRAEGFGRGLAEAMAAGRLALGTDWSGNLDFMSAANALLVPARMVPVRADAYPHGRGQRWAEPDVAAAAALLAPLVGDSDARRARAARGRRDVLRTHGHRAVGLRILDALERIVARGDARVAVA